MSDMSSSRGSSQSSFQDSDSGQATRPDDPISIRHMSCMHCCVDARTKDRKAHPCENLLQANITVGCTLCRDNGVQCKPSTTFSHINRFKTSLVHTLVSPQQAPDFLAAFEVSMMKFPALMFAAAALNCIWIREHALASRYHGARNTYVIPLLNNISDGEAMAALLLYYTVLGPLLMCWADSPEYPDHTLRSTERVAIAIKDLGTVASRLVEHRRTLRDDPDISFLLSQDTESAARLTNEQIRDLKPLVDFRKLCESILPNDFPDNATMIQANLMRAMEYIYELRGAQLLLKHEDKQKPANEHGNMARLWFNCLAFNPFPDDTFWDVLLPGNRNPHILLRLVLTHWGACCQQEQAWYLGSLGSDLIEPVVDILKNNGDITNKIWWENISLLAAMTGLPADWQNKKQIVDEPASPDAAEVDDDREEL